jgi:hypothetical protein
VFHSQVKANGLNGNLSVENELLVITRPFPSFRLGTGREIPLAALVSVELLPATRGIEGFLVLGVGTEEVPDSKSAANNHENAVSFSRKQQSAFEDIRAHLTRVIETNRTAGVNPRAVWVPEVIPEDEPAPSPIAKSEPSARDRRWEEKQATAAAETAEYGRLLVSSSFAQTNVQIFEKGFIRIGGGTFRSPTGPAQRLISIESDDDVHRKHTAGRAAGAVLTGGLNLLGGNKRGEVYLTVITDEGTRVLQETQPSNDSVRIARNLAATGQTTIAAAAQNAAAMPVARTPIKSGRPAPRPTQSRSSTQKPSTAAVKDRLSALSQLLADGVLTQGEHDRRREQIINEL